MFDGLFNKLAGWFLKNKVGLTEGNVGTKKWYQSMTIWSDILTVVVSGVAVADAHFGTHIASLPVYATILSILGAMGIKGRVSADTKISS